MKLLILAFLCMSSVGFGSVFGVAQTGSFMGLLSVGVGDQAGPFQYSLSGGYTPAELAGGESLFGITPRGDLGYLLIDGEVKTRLFVGTGILFSLDKNTFVLLPDHYPDGYYPSTGMLFAPYWGLEIQKEQHGFFIEGSTTDFYLELYLRNRQVLSITDVSTWGIGYKYYFDHVNK